ncbi:MAG: Cna B-type domain-containing protein, partial [Lachnospiraceae bacterium]|nr:Cna B-type domain-containing protein [Lachnospiraceae bacterium]
SNGKEITYTISEDAIEGYSSSIDRLFNIINSYTPKQTVLNVQKVWDDSNNQDGKRPNSVTVQLYADGTASGAPVTLSTSNNWYHTWTELPIYKGGEKIKYTVKETSDLPKGYTPKISGDAEKGYIITNSYTPEKTTVSGTKTWNDNDNQDGKRPEKITVRLLADGEEVSSTTVNAADGWTYKFDNLPVYHDGNKIIYSVSEDAIPDYTTEISGYDITNSYTPKETSVSVLKNWADSDNQDGKRPNDVQVQLLADGDAFGEPVTLTSSNWMYTWKNLPMYKNGGTEINYTVKEVSKLPDGYSSIITGNAVRGYTITNSYQPEKTTISGTKTWDDNNNQDAKRPDSITVKLLADGIKVAEKTVTASDGWKYSFTDLPVYRDGKEITYAVAEEAVPNYSTSINGYDITNSYTPQKTSLSVLKRWYDNENQDGKRPDSVEVQLYADGVPSGDPVTLKSDGNWMYTWENLPMYENGGTMIAYTVQEISKLPEGYSSSVTGSAKNGYVITNSYTPEKTTVSGSKTWKDNDNQDGMRPDSITVKLLADGIKVDEKTVAASDSWKYSFTDLPVYQNGKKITYAVAEEAVANYSTSINGYDITNSYTPQETSLSVLKRWFDNENQDGKRPNSVQVQLYADGAESREPVTLKAENNWLYTWTGLPMYTSDGTKIQYTVQEVSTLPDGYTSTVTGSAEGGYVISNSYTPETFSIDIAKKWEDGNDKDGIRPDSVQVQLLANGKTVGDAVTLNEENQWKNTWTNLAKYANGKEINYSVEEVEVPSGYSVSYSGNVQEGFVVTNKHTPEKTSPTTTPPATPTDTPTTTPPTTPTDTPATTPSTTPTDTPTTTPSSTPTDTPTATPTTIPTGAPTASPSSTPGAPAVPRTPGSNNTNNRNTNQTTGDNSSKVSAGKVSTGRVATGDNTNNRIWQISMMISSALLVLFVIMVVLNRKRDK